MVSKRDGTTIFDKFLGLEGNNLTVAAHFAKAVDSKEGESKELLGMLIEDPSQVDDVVAQLQDNGFIEKMDNGRFQMRPDVSKRIKRGMNKLIRSSR